MFSDRKDERKPLSYRGWIHIPDWPLFTCLIEDASDSGARLMLDEPQLIPDRFKLYFSPTSRNYRECIVRWRRGGSIGVQFANRHMVPNHKAEERAPVTVC